MADFEIKDGVGIIPEGTERIDNDAFEGCTDLTSITIPNSVTEIGIRAFEGCTGLTSITIPDSVTKIGSGAFDGCTGLSSVVIPDSVTEIGDSAFEGCTDLTSIVIPASVTKIDDRTFDGCTGLTSIVIPDSVTEIGDYAFEYCEGLTSITIPDSVTKIGDRAFKGCTDLSIIAVAKNNTIYDSRDNCNAIIKSENNSLIAGCKNTVIPDSVTKICHEAFADCSGLTSITIPDSVKEIGYEAFKGCTGLTSIVIPDSLTRIGYNAFEGCTSLTRIVIPDSVTEIENCAFLGCTGLTSIAIPDSVTEIGSRTFMGCTVLTSIVIPDSVTKICQRAFEGCTGLTSIDIPDSVTEIGWNAFYSCAGLTSIVIPNLVTEIGDYAFEGCTGLTSITIPDSVTKIGSSAFKNCTGLTSITIPDSVTEIGDNVFSECTSLQSISILGPVKKIERTFAGCTGLETVTLGAGIKKIEAVTFEGCTSLKVINVPAKKADYYKNRLPEELHHLIVELPTEKKAKKIKDGQESGDNNYCASFLELIGLKDSKMKLQPLIPEHDPKNMLTITYHVTDDALPFTAELDDVRAREMYVDDKPAKPFKKKVIFRKAGDHVIRLIGDYRPRDVAEFPGSELIKIPDAMTEIRPKPYSWDFGTFYGSKKLLLGAGYNSEKLPEKDFEEIAVVPDNPFMGMQNDCIIMKESQKLLYVSSKTNALPKGIKDFGSWILSKWSSPKLTIPGTVKSVSLDLGKVGCAEEIEFEDGVQAIEFIQNGPTQVRKIILPTTLQMISMRDVEMDSLTIPSGVRIIEHIEARIKRLEILGDFVIQKSFIGAGFNNFDGELFLSGDVKPYEETTVDMPGVQKFFGTTSDNCIIHVKNESVARTIQECVDFNKNAKIIVD